MEDKSSFLQICSGADRDESSTKHTPRGLGVDPAPSEAQALEAGLNWSLSLFFTELRVLSLRESVFPFVEWGC